MNQRGIFNYSARFCTCIDNFISSSTADSMLIGGKFIAPVRSSIVKIQKFDSGQYSIFEISNWFLLKDRMTHAKLQKLCYYAQAWCFTLKGKRLADTDFQAWNQGPVSPALYERFKGFGYKSIEIRTHHRPAIQEEDLEFLEDVWDTYGDKTGNALEALTHRELPWIEARRGYGVRENCMVVITPESMKRYYSSIYNR